MSNQANEMTIGLNELGLEITLDLALVVAVKTVGQSAGWGASFQSTSNSSITALVGMHRRQ